MPDTNALFLDTRPIADMPFAPEVAERVRNILTICRCFEADDINRLGCTGVIKPLAQQAPPTWSLADGIESAQFLRLGLAGGGVGLPCFVPINRFCLVHNTIGGLEPGQLQRYPEQVEAISRELTDEEHGRVALIEAARRTGRKDIDQAADVLAGRQDASDMLREVVGAVQDEDIEDAVFDKTMKEAKLGAQPWKCTEHTTMHWGCRYCVAQAVVEGPLAPTLLVERGVEHIAADLSVRAEMADALILAGRLKQYNEEGVMQVNIYAFVATFTRKLSRD